MAPESTEETVRDEIVVGLRQIAQSGLEFDHTDGNIHDELFEWTPGNVNGSNYLMAEVQSTKRVQAWGVDVVASDDFFAHGQVGALVIRLYRITIRGYYDLRRAPDGMTGRNFLIKHMRKVRGMIIGLGSNLNGRVDRISSVEEPVYERFSGTDNDDGEIVVGSLIMLAEKQVPDF